jgi:hypothetical protein
LEDQYNIEVFLHIVPQVAGCGLHGGFGVEIEILN